MTGVMQILFLNIGHAAAHFFLLLYPTVVLSLEAERGADYGDLLLPSTAGFVALAAATLPAGWLGDRWGRHKTMALFFPGLGIGALWAAFADSATGLAAGLAIIGLAAAIYHPVGIPLLVESEAAAAQRDGVRSRMGRVLGVNGVWGNMGVAAAPGATVLLIGLADWRAAFWVPGLLALFCGVGFLLHCRSGRAARAAATEPPAVSPPDLPLRRPLTFLLLSALFGGLSFNVLVIALPKLLQDSQQDGGAVLWLSGGLASLIFAVAAFAQIPAGRSLDRYDLRRLLMGVIGAQVPIFLLLSLLIGWGVGGLVAPAALLLTVLIFAEIPLNDALAARCAASSWRARLFALKYLLSLGVAALAVPLVALSHDQFGNFSILLAGLGGLVALLALAATLLPALPPPIHQDETARSEVVRETEG